MKRILVIDDDMRYRDLVLPYLQSCGFEVQEAGTVAHGLSLSKKVKFDLLIVDGILPDGSGIEAIKEIRGSGNDVPIVFISGAVKDKPSHDLLTTQLQVSFIRLKPISPEELCRDINELFRSLSPRSKVELPAPKHTGTLLIPPKGSNLNQPESSTEEKLKAAMADYTSSLPRMIAEIREQIEHLARNDNDSIVIDDLIIMRVHKLKGTAGMYGHPALGRLMERIERYLTLRKSKQDFGEDSLMAIIVELRKAEAQL